MAVHLLDHGVAINNLDEFIGLVEASGARIVDRLTANVRTIDSRLYMGAGKADGLAALVAEHAPDVVIINAELSPSQERNLEKHISCRVIDRTRLILDIFALRANSHEGKLQVELAQLDYLSTRLVRGWTHLERQKGGIGLRGPGETQLESDRRMLGVRVSQLKKQLKKVNKRRQISRYSRQVPVVALAGYTNAGKTTLFNRLCHDQQYVADQLFASLDTTLRRIALPGMHQAVLVDTVGFVQNLPHQLVEAFSSTLQEVVQADLILHVCDAGDARFSGKIADVNQVLEEIGAAQIPRLLVWNKSDTLDATACACLPLQVSLDKSAVECVAISATDGEGIAGLLQLIAARLSHRRLNGWFLLSPAEASRNRAFLHRIGAVRQEASDARGQLLLRLEVDAAIVCAMGGIQQLNSGEDARPPLHTTA